MTTTLWDAQEGRWWPAIPVLYALGGVGLTVLLFFTTRLNPWTLLTMLFVPYGLWSVRAARARVRLTPDGVEVRGLRTTLYPYADLGSVELAPAWEGDGRAVWLRLRDSHPLSAPEVLSPPPEWWHAPGRTLVDVVTEIQARIDAAQPPHEGAAGRAEEGRADDRGTGGASTV